MEKIIKKLLGNIDQININKLLENHISDIKQDDDKKRITIVLNKKYVMNNLLKPDKLGNLIIGIHKTFGDDYSTSLKIKTEISHNREMLVPRSIHY